MFREKLQETTKGERIMGISTNGFVLTETKDIFTTLSTIENVLINLVKRYSNKDVPIFRDDTSRLPIIEYSPNSKFFSFCFKVNNEFRILIVHFDCDCDYSEYGGSKIIWSVNYWGLAEEIVLSICKEMKQFGKVFYEANDYDSEVVEV